MVVSVVFTITLKNAESEQAFLAEFAKVQQHCIHNEPGTLTYELHQVFDHGKPVEFKYMVMERYASQLDFETVHSTSTPFKNLFAALGEMEVGETSLVIGSNAASQAALDAQPESWSASNIADPLLQKGVLVFCGARNGNKAEYTQEAEVLGQYIAEELRQPLVYGGGTVGVMGALVKKVEACSGKIISVIPHSLSSREVSGSMLGDRIYTTATMSERKSIMFAHSDTVIALPGGVGTFDELLEVITLFQLNAYRSKIGIVNVQGFFDPFVALLRHLVAEGFLEEQTFDFIVIKPTALEVMAALKNFVPPASPAASLVWKSRP